MKNFVHALCLASIALAASACTRSIDNAELAKKITEDGTSKGWPVKTVTCPANQPFKQGDKFDCTMTFEDGKTTMTSVEQKDDKGNVSWETKNLIVAKEISDALSKNNGGAPVSCGKDKVVIAKEGDKFDCTGTVHDAKATWEVTIGKDGHYNAEPKH